jgi:hypothetical protein
VPLRDSRPFQPPGDFVEPDLSVDVVSARSPGFERETDELRAFLILWTPLFDAGLQSVEFALKVFIDGLVLLRIRGVFH